MKKNKSQKNKVLSVVFTFAILISYIEFSKLYKDEEKLSFSIIEDDIGIEGDYGVSSSNHIATEVGMKILENGGNAVDAAVAVSYVLGVVEPFGSGIGGGGGMLIYDPSQDKFDFFNYRDSAPISSTKKVSSIGVPGFVKGMEIVHKYYGTLKMSDLIQPSINYAQNGFEIDEVLAERINVSKDYLSKNGIYTENGKILKERDVLVQQQLAGVLQKIQKNGSDAFYKGSIAEKIIDNSTLTEKDLAAYKVSRLEPVRGQYLDYEIISAPAPFSGTTLIQMLKMFEICGISNPKYNSQLYLLDLKKITSITSADRVNMIGDPNFYNVDNQYLVSDSYIENLLKKGILEHEEDEEHESTTHFVIIDKDGMLVSATNTLGNFWGSKNYVLGFYLNSSMDNFGDVDGKINSYESGKTPRNFTAPTIVKKGDEYIMGIGSPGGNRIIKILAPVLLDHLQFKTDIQDAVNKSRGLFLDNDIFISEDNNKQQFVDVGSTDYIVKKNSNRFYFGSVQAIGKSSENGIFGASDYRRNGSLDIKR